MEINVIPSSALRNKTLHHDVYDYIFCVTGAAESFMLIELSRNKLLQNAKVLLINQAVGLQKEKIFCFWSKKEEPILQNLKHIVSTSWDTIKESNGKLINLSPLCYKYVSGSDLFEEIQRLTAACGRHKLIAKINHISHDAKGASISVSEKKIRRKRIFDSRTPVHQKAKDSENHIYQSFFGWMIETQKEIQRPEAFRFMDFNVEQQGFTQFVFVLPFSSSKVLVEVARFVSDVIRVNEAETFLGQYIETHFGKITKLGNEQGCIPMSNNPIENEDIRGVTTLGSRNYKIKPNTGYAFKNIYYRAHELAESIKKEENTEAHNKSHAASLEGRFAFYDGLLLVVLNHRSSAGKRIFVELLEKVKIQTILKFLDKKTSIKEDAGLFFQMPRRPFLWTLLQKTVKQSFFQPLMLALIALLLVVLGKHTIAQTTFGYGLFFIGLITIGIPHGAVDHLLETGKLNFKKAPVFILNYLLLSFLMGAIWYLSPLTALIIFLTYSAFHFGEADGKQWKMSPLISTLWGSSVLFYILGTHLQETNAILTTMGNLSFPLSCPVWAILPWLVWAFLKKQVSLAITFLWLVLSSSLPLMFAFGLYFIGQHSFNGWNHIRGQLKLSNKLIWIQSLPFHAGAWLLITLLIFLWPTPASGNQMNLLGLFFILISCISLPHAIAMHTFYLRKNRVKI